MRTVLFLMLAALGGFSGFAEVRSANTFAMVDVASAKANTIIAVPWTGADGDLRADRLVWPQGLTTGDMLLAVTNDVGYAGWILQPVAGDAGGARAWVPMSTAQRTDATSRVTWKDHDGTGTAARGTGLWLIRQATSAPFTLYGLASDGAAAVTVRGGTSKAPTYTMIASPDATRPVDVNALPWPADKIGLNDQIVVPTSGTASQNYLWDDVERKWYYGRTYVKDNGRIGTEFIYTLPIPAGTGFWYVRRTAGDFTLSFTAPAGGTD